MGGNEKHSTDNVQKTQQQSTQGEQTAAKLTEGIWEGPKDGSAPEHGKSPRDSAWEKVTASTMSADEVSQMVQFIKDASGKDQMEFPSPFPGKLEIPEQLQEKIDKEFRDNAKINEDIKDLSPESQKHVKDGINAIKEHDPKGIANFLEHATPEEKAAFIKSLKDIGYKVEETHQIGIGAPSHDRIRISNPDSPLPSGILIDVEHPAPRPGPPMPDFPGSHGPGPKASVAFEK